MGFFALKCSKCQKSVVSKYKVIDGRARSWESDAVALLPDGTVVKGIYDGYGRIEEGKPNDEPDTDLMEHWEDGLKMLHAKCYTGQDYHELTHSKRCELQGFFDE